MIEGVFGALIQICLVVLVVYVVLWVIASLGVPLPPQVTNIIWIIAALFILLILFRQVLPSLGVRVGTIGDPQWHSQVVANNERQQQQQLREWQRRRSLLS